jgi:hypothetical protein
VDDLGAEWALAEDSQVGDWLTYIAEGGTIDPYVEPEIPPAPEPEPEPAPEPEPTPRAEPDVTYGVVPVADDYVPTTQE